MPPAKIEFGVLILKDIGSGFQLDCDFAVHDIKADAYYIAPKGTLTDGASIPRFFWRWIGPPMTGKYRQAAVIHDAAYTGALQWFIDDTEVGYDRKAADGLFLRLMKVLGVSWWRRRLMYNAVRWFGKKRWTAR